MHRSPIFLQRSRAWLAFLALAMLGLLLTAGAHAQTALCNDIAVGSDNQVRLLWTFPSGCMEVESINNAGAPNSIALPYGPLSGFSATHIAAGGNARTSVLWTNTSGAVLVWIDDGSGTFPTRYNYGPFPGWSPVDIAVGPDGYVRMLWNKTDGTACTWVDDGTGTFPLIYAYGPYPGWTPMRIAGGADGLTRLLWQGGDGSAAVWVFDAGNALLSDPVIAPPQIITGVTLSTTSPPAGGTALATVTLDGAAGSAGSVLSLSSTGPISAPPSVFVPPGATQVTFLVAANPVATQQTAGVTVSNANGPPQQATLTISPGRTRTVSPVADASVQAGSNANTNYATAQTLHVDNTTADSNSDANACAYLKFNVPSLATAPIAATLKLTVNSSSSPATGYSPIKVYAVANTWTETGITWNNALGLNTGNFTGSGTLLTQQSVPLSTTTPNIAAFDVTAFVQAHVGQPISFLLIDESSDANALSFNSREAASGAPVLTVASKNVLNDVPAPPWDEDVIPTDDVPSGGQGPSSADYVNLASGVEENQPGPDIVVRNPTGPDVAYTRRYRSILALQGYGSPGLSPGWVDNFDFTVQAEGNALILRDPDGCPEVWQPGMVNGNPTGPITCPPGSAYLVSGTPGAVPGLWASLTMTFKDWSAWTFTPDPFNAYNYLLTTITNVVGHSIHIQRNPAGGGQINEIDDDQGSTLLSFGYQNGYLSTLTDVASGAQDIADYRQVSFSFAPVSGVPGTGQSLASVSQVTTVGANPVTAWSYAYTPFANQPFLSSVGVLSPTGSGSVLSHSIVYDTDGHVNTLADANGNQRIYGYNDTSTSVTVEDSAGNTVQTWTQNFSANDADTGATDAAGNSDSVQYTDPSNPYRPTILTNKNNQSVTLSYDAFGNVTQETPPRQTDAVTIGQYTYDGVHPGQLSQVQEGAKTPTLLTYYQANDPNGAAGLVKTVQTPLPGGTSGAAAWATTSYTYTALGNIATVTVPAPNNSGASVTTVYNYTFDPADNTTKTEALGEPLTVTDPTGRIAHFRYDGRGNVSAVIDALGNRTDFVRNWADQVTSVLYPATGETGLGRAHTDTAYLYLGGPMQSVSLYDESNDQVRQVTATDGNEAELARLSGSTQAQTRAYDAQYRLTHLTDGNSNTLKSQFDPLGNLAQLNYPGNPNGSVGTSDTLVGRYDNDGNLLQRIDGRNLTTTYTLDPIDSRLNQVTAAGAGSEDIRLTYGDAYGRVTLAADYDSRLGYTYDDLDNVIDTSFVSLFLGALEHVSYTFYPDGHRATMTTPAGIYLYTYDLAGNLMQVQFPWGTSVSYDYDPDNRIWHEYQAPTNGYPGITKTYTYNQRGFLTELNNMSTPSNTLLSDFLMTYDAAGNRLTMQESVAAQTDIAAVNRTLYYTYDTQNRLVEEKSVPNGQAVYNDSYDYTFHPDAADNQLSLRGATLAYNADNQPISDTLSHASNPFVYDGDGNPTNYNISTFGTNSREDTLTYDTEDRLGGDNIGGSSQYSVGMLYYPDGTRAWKQVNVTQAAGPITFYLYDRGQVVCELYLSGEPGSYGISPYVSAAYGYGAGGLVQTWQYNDVFDVAGYNSYTFDPGDNIVSHHVPTDTQSLSEDINLFDAFGKYQGGGGTHFGNTPDPAGYGGQWGNYTDWETGLVLMGARYYDPGTARFLTRDPIGYDGGMNVYAYCGNDPVNRIDPSGTIGVAGTCGVLGAVYAGTWICDRWRARARPNVFGKPLTASERNEVNRAIALIRRAGWNGTANHVATMLKEGRLVVDKNNDRTAKAVTLFLPGVDANNVATFLQPWWFERQLDWSTPGLAENSDINLAADLVHESIHAYYQGMWWGTFHQNEREDRAYGAELRFLQTLRRVVPDKNEQFYINDVIFQIVNRGD